MTLKMDVSKAEYNQQCVGGSNVLVKLLTHYESTGYDFVTVKMSNGSPLTVLLHDVAFLHAGIAATGNDVKAINVDSAQFSHDLMAAGNNPKAALERMQKSLTVCGGPEASIIDGEPKLFTFFPKSEVSFADDALVVFSIAYQDQFFVPKYTYQAVMANGKFIEYRVLDRQYQSDVAINVGYVIRCIPNHIGYDIKNPIVRAWAKQNGS